MKPKPTPTLYGFSSNRCITANDVARIQREKDVAMEWIWAMVEALEQVSDLREENGQDLDDAKEIAEDILLRVTEHYKPKGEEL